MQKKLALIVSGGGMTCSYTVGVVMALVKEFHLTQPDIIIAGSGSAGTMAYFVSQQYDSILNIWSNLLSTKKFINPLRFWRIINIDYLIDTVFKQEDALLVDKIRTSPIRFLVPVTNYETGELEYFSNQDDIFEVLRATKAMPLVYNRRVNLNDCHYCDSYLSSNAEPHIAKAINEGATHILIIDSTCFNRLTNVGFNLWLLLQGKTFKQNYTQLKKKKTTIPENIKVFRVRPGQKLEISTLNNDNTLLQKTISIGYEECKNNTELKEFVDSLHTRRSIFKDLLKLMKNGRLWLNLK